jgi:predicted dehydrogenase
VPAAESIAVNVGFIGAGNVLPAYLQMLDRLVPPGLASEGPICARSAEARDLLRSRRPGARPVRTAEEVLGDPEVDLVVILTPPSTHPALVGGALAAGKHVLCEKPLAAGRHEAAELVARARAAERLLLCAPFVHLNPSFRRLWTIVWDGALGHVHAARAHYGNPGSTWAAWYHQEPAATLGDVGIYNLKSLAALLGPVIEVQAASATALGRREVAGATIEATDPDTWQLVLRHEPGALSSVLASHATWRYRRPAIELYGTEGTANLLGDDWDPHGIELYRESSGSWELLEPEDATWLWADGLREAVAAIRSRNAPLDEPDLDVHLHEVIDAAAQAAREGRAVAVESRFPPFEALRLDARAEPAGHVHDHTRPAALQ